MAYVLGSGAKSYRNTGTYNSPTWNENDTVRGLAVSMSGDKFSARRRASGLYHQYAITGIDLSVSWQHIWDLSDQDMMAFHAAFLAGTELDLIFMDGSVASGARQGLRMLACFNKFDQGQGEDALLTADIEVCPGITQLPTWFTGTS